MKVERIIGGLMRRYDRYIKIPAAHRKFSKINILNAFESIRYIIENQCSLSRYGDGEFNIILGIGNGFQQADPQLASRLKQILISSDVSHHSIALPITLKNTDNLTLSAKELWDYFTLREADKIIPFLSENRTYLNTQISRFYIDYLDKSSCKSQLSLLKQIWTNRDVVIIEGHLTRSGVGNDLYDNARSVKRILGPSTNAFSRYNEMLSTILRKVKKNQLILLCYGMTATVLAYDLAKLGYWAIDLGHLDIEYEWYLLGATGKMPIKGKFTNEAIGGNIVEPIISKKYLSEIIEDITK